MNKSISSMICIVWALRKREIRHLNQACSLAPSSLVSGTSTQSKGKLQLLQRWLYLERVRSSNVCLGDVWSRQENSPTGPFSFFHANASLHECTVIFHKYIHFITPVLFQIQLQVRSVVITRFHVRQRIAHFFYVRVE